MRRTTLGLLGLLPWTLGTLGCSSFGTPPSDDHVERFQDSQQFNAEKNEFQNWQPDLIARMEKRTMSWKMIKDFFSDRIDGTPAEKLPEVKPDWQAFLAPSDELKVIWFGHSSFLLNLDSTLVLIDPVFSGTAAPVSFAVNSFQAPVIDISELPPVDYVVISHDHYDHLDMDSMRYFLDKDVTFITPLGVGSHLVGWGIGEDRIIEKDWWESHTAGGLEFTATPAQHFSGRSLTDRNCTLWASWVIKSANHSVYFSGDSGYSSHYLEIGEKLGPFDVAFLESGQYDDRWPEVHMRPKEAVQAFKDLKAKRYFPVHWGMFRLAFHTWYDPIEQLYNFSRAEGFELIAPKIGQLVAVNNDYELEKWWESVPKANEEHAMMSAEFPEQLAMEKLK